MLAGRCDISIAGRGSIVKAECGAAFGELALLHDAPRAATVTAETAVRAFMVDAITFKALLMSKRRNEHEEYLSFVQQIEILQHLSVEEQLQVVDALQEVTVPTGTVIIHEGDEGDLFYIIRDGEVKCTKSGERGEVRA